MKKKMINTVHIEGILYSHTLEDKVTGENSKNPGTSYIAGTIDIATDDACTNVVSIHYIKFNFLAKTSEFLYAIESFQ